MNDPFDVLGEKLDFKEFDVVRVKGHLHVCNGREPPKLIVQDSNPSFKEVFNLKCRYKEDNPSNDSMLDLLWKEKLPHHYLLPVLNSSKINDNKYDKLSKGKSPYRIQ